MTMETGAGMIGTGLLATPRKCIRDDVPLERLYGDWIVQQVMKRPAQEGVLLTGQLFTMQMWVCPVCKMVEFVDVELT